MCLCWSLNASAQDQATEATNESDVSVTRSTNPIALASAGYMPQRGMLMQYARGAVKNVVNNGLVLVKMRNESANSRLYIKFGSDGMPQLRWSTRFGAL